MKIKFSLTLLCLLVCWSVKAQSFSPTNAPGSVTLSWTDVLGTNVLAHDNVYYGVASATYTNKLSTGTSQSTTVSNLVRGKTYYFAVTTTAASGQESAFSNEVKVTPPLPPSAPSALVITSGD